MQNWPVAFEFLGRLKNKVTSFAGVGSDGRLRKDVLLKIEGINYPPETGFRL